jgi:hypothetical protein
VRVTIADQKGFFSFKKPFKIPSKVLIQVRKVGLPNGGFNILAEPGNYISTLQNATLLNYNTQRCRERDSFESLFQGANRITSFFEYLQGELAALREILIAQGIPRAVRDNESRIQIHAENYYRLSASLPDIQLLCAKDQSNCSKVVFSQERRKLLHSVRELRSEALLLNRVIRTNGRRNEASSRKRVAQIIRRSNRIRTIVNSLPRFSFSCS